MRKWITLLMTLLVGCGSYANATMGQVTFEAGYRQDSIDWRTNYPSDDPFLKTSTKFNDLDIFQIGVHGRTTLGYNLYLRGNAYWGWILDGDFKHTGSLKVDPRRRMFGDGSAHFGFSDSYKSTVDDQYVFGVNGAIGYPFFFCNCTMVVAPVIGYSVDEQNIRVNNRDLQFGQDYGYASGGGNGCRNTFISRWYGPFVGLDFDWRPVNTCFNVWAELEYHWGNFRGKVSDQEYDNGDIASDHRNRHSDNATAWVFGAGFDYDLCNCWTVGLSVKFQDWSANRHHKECNNGLLSYADTCDHRFKDDNNWHSYAINLTFGRDF